MKRISLMSFKSSVLCLAILEGRQTITIDICFQKKPIILICNHVFILVTCYRCAEQSAASSMDIRFYSKYLVCMNIKIHGFFFSQTYSRIKLNFHLAPVSVSEIQHSFDVIRLSFKGDKVQICHHTAVEECLNIFPFRSSYLLK